MKKQLLLLFLWLFAVSLWAQQRVTGKVTSSDDGEGLPGVSIVEKGTGNGTITDVDGNYSITVPGGSILTFSFVGYMTRDVEVGSRSVIDMGMELDITQLSEVVVIGYGQVQKEDLTGAVAKVDSKDFNKGVLTSPQDLLIGRIAGVQVTSNSGAPGAGATIRIRGGSSISANNDPLIVVDGLPIDNTNVSGISNPLSTINPNDIESFTVLKDASATAIYGSRASNGVIIITTKKGKRGRPEFNFSNTVSISQPIAFVEVLDGDQYRSLIGDLNEQGFSGINDAAAGLLGEANTDWQSEIFQTAISHDHNLSVSGTFRELPFRASYGYTAQEGILKTTQTNRHSFSLSMNPSFIDDLLKVNFNVKQTFAQTNFGDAGAVGAAVSYDPTQPVYSGNSDFGGFFTYTETSGRPNTFVSNPVALLELRDNSGNVGRLMGNVQLDFTLPFFRDLSAVLNLGLDKSSTEGRDDALPGMTWIYRDLADDLAETGRLLDYTAENSNELLDFYLKYNKEQGVHRLEVTGGYSWQHFYRESTNYSRSGDETFVIDDTQLKSENYLISFFGRLNYILNNKYLLTATLRNDGSSRFIGDNKWGMFPAVALGWRLSDESFMSGLTFLSEFKLRAGYGVTGQQDINVGNNPYYPALPIYRESIGGASYQFGNEFVRTLRPDPYDANIKWEETVTYNIGADFGFWQDRLYGSVEVYKRKTKDLINRVPIPGGSNFSNFLITNVGNLENDGVEVTLNAVAVSNARFTWNAGVNMTRNTNKITKLTLVDDPDYAGVDVGGISGGVGNTVQKHAVGHPAFSYFLFQQVYDTDGDPVEGLYVNRTGEAGDLTSDLNKYYAHNPAPEWTIGVNSRINVEQFDFSFSGRFSINNYVYNNIQSNAALSGLYLSTAGGYFTNITSDAADLGFTNFQYWSDYYLENASFFKMDNVSVGYTLQELFTDRLQARFSFTVQNAFIVTKYSGLDPEVNGGIDNNIYPRPRTYLLGVNLNF